MSESVPSPDLFPEFGAERLLIIGTGSMAAAHLPSWSTWLEMGYPHIDRRLVLTRSATKFVSHVALNAMEKRPVELDVWSDDPAAGPLHVDLATWPDAVIVYPATFDFLARFAVGLGDTPATLGLQCTSAVIGLAPSLPPGAADSEIYRRHVRALEERTNVTLVTPVPGLSAHTGKFDAAVAAPLQEVIVEVERLRTELAEVPEPC
ncbi:flavoprotein [Nocardiopsis ganjiahuensis]|uniref:flavoprotein n=1 Tax=Nocardiopsis ganjiahuensis TaxID=239984 RepID=UPI00034D8CEA|nr:flavoprotein [Nocardiopsis ganjiahuensis]